MSNEKNNSALLESESTKTERTFLKLARYLPKFAIVGFLLVLLVYFWVQGSFNFYWGDQAVFGAFGDFVGGLLNPIFSFFTILLLVYSIRFQIDEIKETRVEIVKASNIHSANNKQQKEMFEVERVLLQGELLEKELFRVLNRTILDQEGFGPASLLSLMGSLYKSPIPTPQFHSLVWLLIEDKNQGSDPNEKQTGVLGFWFELQRCDELYLFYIAIKKKLVGTSEIIEAKDISPVYAYWLNSIDSYFIGLHLLIRCLQQMNEIHNKDGDRSMYYAPNLSNINYDDPVL